MPSHSFVPARAALHTPVIRHALTKPLCWATRAQISTRARTCWAAQEVVALRSVGATVLLLRTLFGWSLYGDYGGLYLARAVLWGSTGGGDTGRAPVSGDTTSYTAARASCCGQLSFHTPSPACLGTSVPFRDSGLGFGV